LQSFSALPKGRAFRKFFASWAANRYQLFGRNQGMAKKHLLPANSPLRRNTLAYLSAEERRKYELAKELGLLDLVRDVGWAGLSAKETGRIGGLMGQEKRKPGAGHYPERP
jgi:hypothetical protein